MRQVYEHCNIYIQGSGVGMYPSCLGLCGHDQGRPDSDTSSHDVAGGVSSRPCPGDSDVGDCRLYDGRCDNDVR